MLDIELFSKQIQRLEKVFNYKLNDRIDIYWEELQKINFDNDSFVKVVDAIVLNEIAFPKIAIFKKYADEISCHKSVSTKIGDAKCQYCGGNGRVLYEKYEDLYKSFILSTVFCICVKQDDGTYARYNLHNIESIGLKELIDEGKFKKDENGVYRNIYQGNYRFQKGIDEFEEMLLVDY